MEHLISAKILIVGAGPAGLAAAAAAAANGESVVMVDESASLGGQLWNGEERHRTEPQALNAFRSVERSNIRIVRGVTIFHAPEPHTVLGEGSDGTYRFTFEKLIIAMGARERFLPFPGWTLPNVVGAGGLQAIVKSGLSVRGKRIIVAGSGPLLLAVAAFLKTSGAEIPAVVEQADAGAIYRFARGLFRHPSKILQFMTLRNTLAGTPYWKSAWVVEAIGDGCLSSVVIRHPEGLRTLQCDYLACGFHLVPNLEMPLLAGCAVDAGGIRVDELQAASIPDVYAVGESAGIGGSDLAIVQGTIAGYAASGNPQRARKLFRKRASCRRFAGSLNRAFSLREELKSLPAPDTFLCRCEDVRYGDVRNHASWRDAKLQTRCGMGTCQGRICGSAAEFLFGWDVRAVRPPVLPVKVESLL